LTDRLACRGQPSATYDQIIQFSGYSICTGAGISTNQISSSTDPNIWLFLPFSLPRLKLAKSNRLTGQ
jgi:hypothetical protein